MPTFRDKLDDALYTVAEATLVPTGDYAPPNGLGTAPYIRPSNASVETPGPAQGQERTVITGPAPITGSTISRFLLKPLNPFYSDYNTFGGTPDFIAPETVSGGGRFDDDMVVNFYNVLRNTRPELARLWRPVVIWFRRYELACIELLNRTPVREDKALADKLDTVSINDIVYGARSIRDALAGMENPVLATIKQLFERFYTSLSTVAPLIRKSLGGGRDLYFGREGLRGRSKGPVGHQVGADEVDLGKLHKEPADIEPPAPTAKYKK